jgi:hypothetical protein
MASEILKIELHFPQMMCDGLVLLESNNKTYTDNKMCMVLTAVPDLSPAAGKSQL